MDRGKRLSGFLNKQSPRSLMGLSKRRWFNLEGHNLMYYTQPGESKALGFIPLMEVAMVVRKTDKSFILITPTRDWVLSAPNADVIDRWVLALQNILFQMRKPAPPPRDKMRRDTDITKYKDYTPKKEMAKPTPPPVPSRNLCKSQIQPKIPPPVPARKTLARISAWKPQGKITEQVETKQQLQSLLLEKQECENEEMKLLLKFLQCEKPFPSEDIEKQQEYENRIAEYETEIQKCENKVDFKVFPYKLHTPPQRKRKLTIQGTQ